MNERSFSFPILSTSQITEAMEALNFDINSKTLSEPNYNDVVRIFEFFVESLMGISLNEEQNTFASLNAFSFPELHTQSVNKLTFFRAISVLMPAIGVHDFTISEDIIHPSPKRIKKILSAFINFFRFREENLRTYGELTKETDELMQKLVPSEEENEQLQAKLQALIQQNQQQEPQVQKLEEECVELTNKLHEVETHFKKIRNEAEGLKEAILNGKQQILSIKKQTKTARNDCETIRAQIVANPEKVKALMQQMEESIEIKENATKSSQLRAQQLNSKISSLKAVTSDIEACCSIMEECVELKTVLDEEEKDFKSFEDELKTFKVEKKNLSNKEQQLQFEIEHISKKIQELPSLYNPKIEEAQQELKILEDHKRKFQEEEAPSKLEKIQSNTKQVDLFQVEMEEIVTKQNLLIESMSQNYKDLQNYIDQFHFTLFSALEKC